MISSPVYCPEFVGRRRELSFLLERAERGVAGAGCVALVTGESGIGKTRLVEEFIARVRDRASVASGRCQSNLVVPYLPFVSIERALFPGEPLFVAAPSEEAPEAPGAENSGSLFARMLDAVVDLGKRQPFVLVIEDVQWADAATQALILFLAPHFATTRGMLLLTVRSDAPRGDAPPGFYANLERLGARTIAVPALSKSEMEHLIRRALEGRRPLPHEAVELIRQRAEGNPLFAEELLKGALEAPLGYEHLAQSSVRSLRASVLDRLQQFGEDEQQVLMYAAVLGQEFDAAFLAQLVGEQVTKVLGTLRRARNSQLIRELDDRPPRFAFRHVMLRDTIYQELLTAERVLLHGSIAARVEESADLPNRDALLAYHWSAAHEPEKAVEFNERAGDAAAVLFAYDDAARFYERAFGFAEPGKQAAKLAEKAARALFVNGLSERTRSAFERALREYEQLGDLPKVGEMLLAMSRQAWNDAESEEGIALAQRALAALEGTRDVAARGFAYVMMASYCSVLGRADEALRYVDGARALGRLPPETKARLHDSHANALASDGQTVAAMREYRRAIELADPVNDPDLDVRVHSNFAEFLFAIGDTNGSIEHWRTAYDAARGSGYVGRRGYAGSGLAAVRLARGELAEASRLLLDVEASGASNPSVRILRMAVGLQLGMMLRDEGLTQLCASEDTMALALRSLEPVRVAQAATALVRYHEMRGDHDSMQTLIEKALAALPGAAYAQEFLVEVARLGDSEHAERAIALLRKWHAASKAPVSHAYLLLAEAARASRERRPREVVAASARTAAEIFAAAHLPLMQARALETAGRSAEARTIYLEIGAVHDTARLDETIAEKRHRGRAGTALTAREREVAALVAAGETNVRIAARLGISERTVEHHLESVFNRLGIRSRWQLTQEMLAG